MFTIDQDNNSIYLVRGDSFEASIEIYDNEGKQFNPKAGDKLTFTLKENTLTKTVLIEKETGKTIRLNPEDTADLPYGDYVYDVRYDGQDGWRDSIIPTSNFTIGDEVGFMKKVK